MTTRTRQAILPTEKGQRKVASMPAPPVAKPTTEAVTETATEVTKNIFVEFTKAEEQIVTGVVLQPEITDAQGDIMSSDVIKRAAHNFLSVFNRKSKLGLMHKSFAKRFDLLESYIAPQSLVINNKVIKEGKIKGFSIGGKAKVKKVSE